MLRSMIALSLFAAPAAALAQQSAPASPATGDWGIAALPNGCMVQAVSPGGTMLSIWGFAGEDKLAFLLQNPSWKSIRDGGDYDIRVDFLGVRTMPVDATPKQNIDSDGPGFLFTVQPGAGTGTGFIDAFATASGMRIVRDGESVDTLPLAGSRGAMAALARCLADKWSAAAPAQAAEEDAAAAKTISDAI
ncbi:MAG TPA: hypothetical protein VF727_00840 [Allosphingosinicella sp.]|jgi:hypothetical protein